MRSSSPQWEFLSQLGILKVLGQHLDIEWGSRYDMCENLRKKTYSESLFKLWFLFWNGAVYLQVSLLVYTFQSNFLGTFWWASLKSHWSCWTVLWHKPVHWKHLLFLRTKCHTCCVKFWKPNLRTYSKCWSYLSLLIYRCIFCFKIF